MLGTSEYRVYRHGTAAAKAEAALWEALEQVGPAPAQPAQVVNEVNPALLQDCEEYAFVYGSADVGIAIQR